MSIQAEAAPATRPLRVGRDTAWLIGSNVGGAALSLAIVVLIGRVLGADGLGAYAVPVAYVYPLTLISDFGIGTLLTRDLAAAPETSAAMLALATRARLLISGGLCGLLIACAPLLMGNDGVAVRALVLAAPLVVINPFYSQFTPVFKAYGRVAWVAALNIGMLAAQAVFTLIVLANGGGVLDALVVNTLTSAGQLVAAWALWWRLRGREEGGRPEVAPSQFAPGVENPRLAKYLKPVNGLWWRLRYPEEGGRPNDHMEATLSQFAPGVENPRLAKYLKPVNGLWWELWHRLLRRAWPFAWAAFLAAAQARVLIILLERLSSADAVGVWAAASRFTEAVRLLPNAYFGALFPALAALAATPALLQHTFSRAQKGMMLYGVVACIGFLLGGQVLLALVFGTEFGVNMGTWLALGAGLAFSLLRGLETIRHYANGWENRVNRVNAAALIVLVALAFLLIPAAGIAGAAWALCLAEVAAFFALVAPLRFDILHPGKSQHSEPT